MLRQGSHPANGADRHLCRRPETNLPGGLGSFSAPATPALVPGNMGQQEFLTVSWD